VIWEKIPSLAIAAAARQIGAWHFELKTPEEFRDLVKNKNLALLSAIDDLLRKTLGMRVSCSRRVEGTNPWPRCGSRANSYGIREKVSDQRMISAA
jgi:hypothetical protein